MRHQRHTDPLQHMNHDHADELLTVARVLGRHPDATRATAQHVDRHGLDLRVETLDGTTEARVAFAEPIAENDYPAGVRIAFVRLVRRARGSMAS